MPTKTTTPKPGEFDRAVNAIFARMERDNAIPTDLTKQQLDCLQVFIHTAPLSPWQKTLDRAVILKRVQTASMIVLANEKTPAPAVPAAGTAVPAAPPTPGGDWSAPMTLKDLSRCLQQTSTDKVHTLLDPYGLRRVGGNRQSYTVRLDGMDPCLAAKIRTGPST